MSTALFFIVNYFFGKERDVRPPIPSRGGSEGKKCIVIASRVRRDPLVRDPEDSHDIHPHHPPLRFASRLLLTNPGACGGSGRSRDLADTKENCSAPRLPFVPIFIPNRGHFFVGVRKGKKRRETTSIRVQKAARCFTDGETTPVRPNGSTTAGVRTREHDRLVPRS